MNYIGIDVSKDTFVAAFPTLTGFRTHKYTNDAHGIKEFIDELNPRRDKCIMEATGNYCYLLLYLLKKKRIHASMINPKQSKNFSRMMMDVLKNDEKDACLLSIFGQKMNPADYVLPPRVIQCLKQKRTVIRHLKSHRTNLQHLIESLSVLPIVDKKSIIALERSIYDAERQIEILECDLINKTTQEYTKQMSLLQSIQGIGAGLAAELIVVTGGFKNFNSAKQVTRYLGICPTYFQSGVSLHSSGGISHCGDTRIRSLLYMASLNAMQTNKACRECYNRLKGNHKASKVALIAVANKLVRQAFAVIKSGLPYQDGFVSANPRLTECCPL